MIREWLDALVPPGDDGGGRAARHAAGGGGDADRLRAASRLGSRARPLVVAPSPLASRAELIDVALASAHVPFFLDGRARARGPPRARRSTGRSGYSRRARAARAAIRAGEVLAAARARGGPCGSSTAPTRPRGDRAQSDFLVVSPEGLYAMIDAGRAAVRRRHGARPGAHRLGAAVGCAALSSALSRKSCEADAKCSTAGSHAATFRHEKRRGPGPTSPSRRRVSSTCVAGASRCRRLRGSRRAAIAVAHHAALGV